jgi:beta-glucosidase
MMKELTYKMAQPAISQLVYRDTALPIDVRVSDMVARMTLEEKISQMGFTAPEVKRLGISAHNWWNECLHGLGRAGTATVFPQAIGLGATWNPDLVHRVAMVTSDEARAKHHEAQRRDMGQMYTGLTYWSPNVNIFRDPRWGRGQETYGEDPYLTASVGVAFIKGLQGDDPQYLKLAATAKHYAVHSGPEHSRHHFDAAASEQDMRETYLPAFEACVKAAKVASVMGAYNRVNGEPACASPTLLEQILRREWGFDGYVVSDCGAILDIYAHHKVVDTPEEAAALAVKNGCELNCGEVYHALLDAVAQELITEDQIDLAVKRLLTARFRLGMFDPPDQVPYAQIPYTAIDAPAHRQLALQTAREAIVLLKNDERLLPLSKDLRAIAVIGPNADDVKSLLGNYHGTPAEPVTPLEGIRRKVAPTTKVYYAQGCAFADGIPPLDVISSDCLRPADASAGTTGLSAAYYGEANFEGEPLLRRVDPAVDFVWKDTSPLNGRWGDPFAIRWTGYLVPPAGGVYTLGVEGFNGYSLYLDGELIISRDDIHHPVRVTKPVTLEAGRRYHVRLDHVSRGLDPQIKLLWSMPGVDYEARAIEAAKNADVVVLAMGLSPWLEGEEMPAKGNGFAGGDRTDIALPRPQAALIKQIHALGKPVVLVLLNGSAVAVSWEAEHIPAIVEAWYPGQASGDAIADVLFGDYNPAGRLPVTFYRSVDDLPPFEDYRMEGRTYRYFRGKPLFAFGHGLSYTAFEYSSLQIDRASVEAGGEVVVSFDVTNTGDRAGDEVAQLYTRRAAASGPSKTLAGFTRIALQPGERKTLAFTLHTHQLAVYDDAAQCVVLPGRVEVMAGGASDDLPLAGQFEITGRASVPADKVFFSQTEVSNHPEITPQVLGRIV